MRTLLLALLALGPGCGTAPPVDTEHAEEAQLWTCGMHPEVVQDHPGTCPICGMDLIPLVPDANDTGPRELRLSPAAAKLPTWLWM